MIMSVLSYVMFVYQQTQSSSSGESERWTRNFTLSKLFLLTLQRMLEENTMRRHALRTFALYLELLAIILPTTNFFENQKRNEHKV